jgi:hypothetical protein
MSVDVFAVGCADNKNKHYFFFNCVGNPVITRAYAVQFFIALQFFAALWTRILSEGPNTVNYLMLYVPILFVDKFGGVLCHFNLIHP